MKSPLTKKQLDHVREKLLDLRERLLTNVTAMEAEALKASGGVVTRAAEIAGVNRKYIHRAIRRHGLRDSENE